MKQFLFRMKKHLPELLLTMLLFIAFLCFYGAGWYIQVYGDIGFDAILNTILSGIGGVEKGLYVDFIWSVLLPGAGWTFVIMLTLLSGVLINIMEKLRTKIGIMSTKPTNNEAGKSSTKSNKNTTRKITGVTVILLTIIMLTNAGKTVGLFDYVNNLFRQTKILEEHYVNPNEVDITFPEEKRNLIYIFLESMETTYFDKKEGGALDVNIIPELYDLAEENINFSQNQSVGGFHSVSGTTWTIGAMVGQTAGIPLKTPKNLSDMQNGYGKEGKFLPGVTTLSDIFHENGYVQCLMVGSRASFGGRSTYYRKHNTDYIYDLGTARMEDIVDSDYFVWWGMEDKHLFDYAKDKLEFLSQGKEPFAFTMLTVDTHHIGGYVCELCKQEHEQQYENVISCSSRQVAEFVDWIKAQDFYENTTIIITGDHPTMDRQYIVKNVQDNYDRRIYNCFINAAGEDTYSKNRDFCSLDMFPTTLGALGCTIEGDRLGLGTNLFSGKKTLIEEMGFEEFNSQVAMGSEYYEREFLEEQDGVSCN